MSGSKNPGNTGMTHPENTGMTNPENTGLLRQDSIGLPNVPHTSRAGANVAPIQVIDLISGSILLGLLIRGRK